MAKLIYTVISSLDGYIADRNGGFEWAAPDEEEHAYVNDLERPIGTHLYGRRLYETMQVWGQAEFVENEPAVIKDYAAVWRAAEKIVFSSTLNSVSTERTRIEPVFDVEKVRALTEQSDADVSIGGPTLAAHAIRAGLVDEYHFFLHPIVVGGGLASLPNDVKLELELVDEHRFGSGVVHLHYRAPAG